MPNNYYRNGGQPSNDRYHRRGNRSNRNDQHRRGGQHGAWNQGGGMQPGGRGDQYDRGSPYGQQQQYEIPWERRPNYSDYGFEHPNYAQSPYGGGQDRDYSQGRGGGSQDGRNDGFDHHQFQDDNGNGVHQRRSPPRRDRNFQDYDRNSERRRIEGQVEDFIRKTASSVSLLDPNLDLDLDVDIRNYRNAVESWDDMGLKPVLKANIGRLGLTIPRKVQKVAISLLLANNRNLVIRSESGTGKTMCFAIPIVQWILEMNPRNREEATEKGIVLALVLEPTRELVEQVGTAIRALCIGTGINVHVAHGGSGFAGNEYQAGKGCLIVVSTINEVYRMQQQNYMSFDLLELMIFDEAEKQFMDARPTPQDNKWDEKLIDVLSHRNMTSLGNRRNVLVSSTRGEGFHWALRGILAEVHFISVSIAERRQLSPRINMNFYDVDEEKKNELLRALIENDPSKKVLVFCKSIDACKAVLPFLDHLGAVVFPSDQIQEDRERRRALIRFNNGEKRILLATNVLARGIEFHNLEKVFIFDLTNGLTDGFIHRCGRVGRLSPGDVHVFVDKSDKKCMLKEIDLLARRQGEEECVPSWIKDLYAEQPVLDSAKAGLVSSSGPTQASSSNLPISKQHAVENAKPNDAQALPQELPSPLINSTPESAILQMSSELPHLPLATVPIQRKTVSVSAEADSDQLSLVDRLENKSTVIRVVQYTASLIGFLILNFISYLVSAIFVVPRQMQNVFVWAIGRDSENEIAGTNEVLSNGSEVNRARAVVKENKAGSKGKKSKNMKRRNKKK